MSNTRRVGGGRTSRAHTRVHADTAISFGTSVQPGNGLGAVASLVAEGIELAARVAASAHILNDDIVAVASEPDRMSVDHGGRNVASVGLAHQYGRVGAWTGWVVVIRNQFHSIRHTTADAAFEAHAVAAIDPTGFAGTHGLS